MNKLKLFCCFLTSSYLVCPTSEARIMQCDTYGCHPVETGNSGARTVNSRRNVVQQQAIPSSLGRPYVPYESNELTYSAPSYAHPARAQTRPIPEEDRVEKQYYPSGELLSEIRYTGTGRYDWKDTSVIKLYDKSGNLTGISECFRRECENKYKISTGEWLNKHEIAQRGYTGSAVFGNSTQRMIVDFENGEEKDIYQVFYDENGYITFALKNDHERMEVFKTSDGRDMIEPNMRDSNYTGEATTYQDNEKLTSQWKNGKLQYTEIYNQDTNETVIKYNDGKETKTYDKDGLKTIITLENNKNGTIKAYYKNGQLAGNMPIVPGWNSRDSLLYGLSWRGYFIDGIVKEYYQNGQLKAEIPMKKLEGADNETKNGTEKEYGENGNLTHEIPWEDNKKNGIEKEYGENGNLTHEISWKDDKKNGIEKLYDESGKIRNELYWENGREKEFVEYGKRGDISYETHYSGKNRKSKIGIEKEYYDNGQLKAEIHWNYGSKNGVEKEYYPNGQLSRETPWTSDSRDGIEKMYYDNGQMKHYTFWKDNKKNDKEEEFWENGQIKSETHWKDNEKTGIKRNYDRDGNTTVAYNYDNQTYIPIYEIDNGKKTDESLLKESQYTGKLKKYYKSGKLEIEEQWKNGVKDGIYAYYNEDGKILTASHYTNGNIDKNYPLYFDASGKLTNDRNLRLQNNPYMQYTDVGHTANIVKEQINNTLKGEFHKGGNEANDRLEYEFNEKEYFEQALKEIPNYKGINGYNSHLICERSVEETTEYSEYDENCLEKTGNRIPLFIRDCMRDAVRSYYPPDEITKCQYLANNWRETCKRNKERTSTVCRGEAQFKFTNGYDETILKIASFKQPNMQDIPYSRVVQALLEKYGAATYSLRGLMNGSAFETFYWVDGEYVLRVQLIPDNNKYDNTTRVKHISTYHMNPSAYNKQTKYLQEMELHEKLRKLEQEKRQEMQKQQKIKNFKL